jgi:hypothetical protein
MNARIARLAISNAMKANPIKTIGAKMPSRNEEFGTTPFRRCSSSNMRASPFLSGTDSLCAKNLQNENERTRALKWSRRGSR